MQMDVSIKYLNFFLEDEDELEAIKKVTHICYSHIYSIISSMNCKSCMML
jgi:hypothetical protein